MGAKNQFKNAFTWLHTNYYWVVAGILILMIFVHGGAMNNFSTLHLIPITEHLSIARADFALAYGIKNIASMVSTFFSGFIITKWGSRITAPLGLLLMGVSYVVVANVTSLPMLMVGCLLMGISYGFCTTSGAVVAIRLWFHRHEGTVLGVVTAASGIGGSLLSIFQTAVMEKGGFQASLYLCAGLAFGLVVLSFLLLRNRPEDIGLAPLGEGERRGRRPSSVGFAGFSMQELVKQPAFYLLLFCVILSSFSLYLAFNVIHNFFLDCGFSAAMATGLYSAMMLLVTLTKFLTGFCSDRIGAKKTNLVCVACGAVSLLLLAVMKNLAVAVAAVIAFSVALPIVTLMGPLVAGELIGYRAKAQYAGILVSAVSMANLFGNFLTNLIYDVFGSYRPAFALAAALSVVSILLFLILYRMTDRMKAKLQK